MQIATKEATLPRSITRSREKSLLHEWSNREIDIALEEGYQAHLRGIGRSADSVFADLEKEYLL